MHPLFQMHVVWTWSKTGISKNEPCSHVDFRWFSHMLNTERKKCHKNIKTATKFFRNIIFICFQAAVSRLLAVQFCTLKKKSKWILHNISKIPIPGNFSNTRNRLFSSTFLDLLRKIKLRFMVLWQSWSQMSRHTTF